MMRWYLKSLIGQYNSVNPNERLTYRQIAQDTGLSLSSISQIANNNTARADFATIESLLQYFSTKMGRLIGVEELIVWIPEEVES